jgi:deoxyribodipyrimidine photo-lyase
MSSNVIVWFRDDLRLSDHPALHAAAKSGAPVIGLYVFDDPKRLDRDTETRPLGGAARWWLAQSLRRLQASLDAIGGTLVLRRGPAAKAVTELAREIRAGEVFWNEIAQAAELASANKVEAALRADGVEVRKFPGDLLVDPAILRAKNGRALRVFTPFWRRVLAIGAPPKLLPAPTSLPFVATITRETVESLGLEPDSPDWAAGLRQTWDVGERAARERLRTFLADGIVGYARGRDRPDIERTSNLSPHLRFGEISPRQIWHAAQFAAAERPSLAGDIDKFISELGWREFCRHLLFDAPEMATRNLQPAFDAFPWRPDRGALRAWQRGQTGYPMVDAGMRQLWQTGTMHNRVRMVVASFLVKHLLIDWREGERWFWDTLVDADAASNPANWQWVAGCGALLPRLQSDSAGCKIRSPGRLCPALGSGTGRPAGGFDPSAMEGDADGTAKRRCPTRSHLSRTDRRASRRS